MHSVPHLASAAFYAGFEHSGNTCRASKLITGSRQFPTSDSSWKRRSLARNIEVCLFKIEPGFCQHSLDALL